MILFLNIMKNSNGKVVKTENEIRLSDTDERNSDLLGYLATDVISYNIKTV